MLATLEKKCQILGPRIDDEKKIYDEISIEVSLEYTRLTEDIELG